jgi:hypothetical protein
MKNATICSILLVLFFVTTIFAQHDHTQEISWEVPELKEYHEVIYTLWHDAWPKKDTELLKTLLPDLEKGYAKLAAKELPGILRDKEEKWNSFIKELGQSLQLFKTAIDNKDDETLLKEAENIHTFYEKLVRTIRPVLKEIDAFHQELYMLFHYYLPEYDLPKITQAAQNLKAKNAELLQASLPARLSKKETQFNEKRAALSNSVEHLVKLTEGEAPRDQIEQAIDELHTDYQNLEALFD